MNTNCSPKQNYELNLGSVIKAGYYLRIPSKA